MHSIHFDYLASWCENNVAGTTLTVILTGVPAAPISQGVVVDTIVVELRTAYCRSLGALMTKPNRIVLVLDLVM